jgi:hypothetical protein
MAGDIKPRIDGIFQARTSTRFPLFFTLFGAYENAGMDLHGISNNFGTLTITDFALTEYSSPRGLNLNWIAGGSAGVGLFSVEIQKHLSHLYFNRIYGVLSVRNQIYDGQEFKNAEGIQINDLHLIQSLMLKISARISFLPFVKTPVYIEPYVTGAWKFTNAITGKRELWDIWNIYIGMDTSF